MRKRLLNGILVVLVNGIVEDCVVYIGFWLRDKWGLKFSSGKVVFI